MNMCMGKWMMDGWIEGERMDRQDGWWVDG